MSIRTIANQACALALASLAFADRVRAQDAAPAPAPEDQAVLSLSLEDAQRMALENNLGLRIESLTAEVALYNYRATWGSFDWVLDARLGYSDAEFQPRDFFGGTSETNRDLSFDFTRPFAATGGTLKTHLGTVETKSDSGFQVEPTSTTDIISLQYTQPLLRGAWRELATSTQRESELNSRTADEHLRQVRQKLVLDVCLAYWDLVAARDALVVATSSLELAKTQVEQDQRRLEVGITAEVQVLQAQAEAATREEARLKAEVDLRKAADVLKQLLIPGTDAKMWDRSVVPITEPPEPDADESVVAWDVAFQIAIERRSELRQQRLAVDTAEVLHQRARGNQKPALDLDLTASSQGFSGDAGDAFETTARYDYPTYRAALVFNYALGNTNGRNIERATWASIRAARLAYDELESKIVAEVRDGVRQVRYQAQAVRAADKSLELARRQLANEEARYQNDQSTTFQVLQFQQDLAKAMSSARSARSGYAKACATLSSVQGLLGDAPAR